METKKVARRKHSAQFKAEVVQACRQDGASVAAIALRSGLNANVVYRWLRQDAACLDAGAVRPTGEFIAMQLPPPPAAQSPNIHPDIRIEVRRANASIVVNWPLQGAHSCAAWLREVLR